MLKILKNSIKSFISANFDKIIKKTVVLYTTNNFIIILKLKAMPQGCDIVRKRGI